MAKEGRGLIRRLWRFCEAAGNGHETFRATGGDYPDVALPARPVLSPAMDSRILVSAWTFLSS
jgi:hypothetical protein